MTALSPFDEVIRDFATAQHLPRIKKLLVYACTQQWQSDIDRLAQFNLHELVATLIQLAPTLDQLQSYLNQVTQTLSKPAEYLLIANTIVQHLRPLYVGPISSPDLQTSSHLYWQMTQILEQEPEHLRIRKLLVLVCRNYWESDRDRLLAIDLPDLLMELHHLTQSLENLRAVITSVVQTTSKPVQYQAIADRIINACQSFYRPIGTDDIELRSIPESTAAHSTHIHPTDLTYHEPLNSSCHPGESSSGEGRGECGEGVDREFSTDGGDRRLYAQPIPAFSRAELYDLRLEMMKYTVPLLAKHLLFLIVYTPPGQASEQEQAAFAADPDAWMSLKNHDLDDLIKASLKHYPTLDDLNTALLLTVRSLPTAQRYMPIATAIVRAVRTLMAKSTFARSELLKSTSQQTVRQGPDLEQEGTRQVFSSTVTFQEQSVQKPSSLLSSPPSSSFGHLTKESVGAIAPTPSPQVTSPVSSSAETACLPSPDAPNGYSANSQSTDIQPEAKDEDAHSPDRQREPRAINTSNQSSSTDETAFLT